MVADRHLADGGEQIRVPGIDLQGPLPDGFITGLVPTHVQRGGKDRERFQRVGIHFQGSLRLFFRPPRVSQIEQ
jgi:hypothetical protein